MSERLVHVCNRTDILFHKIITGIIMHMVIIIMIGRNFPGTSFFGRKECISIRATIPNPALKNRSALRYITKIYVDKYYVTMAIYRTLVMPGCCDIHRVTLIRIDKIKYVIIDS
jgi:hypothetical protein